MLISFLIKYLIGPFCLVTLKQNTKWCPGYNTHSLRTHLKNTVYIPEVEVQTSREHYCELVFNNIYYLSINHKIILVNYSSKIQLEENKYILCSLPTLLERERD